MNDTEFDHRLDRRVGELRGRLARGAKIAPWLGGSQLVAGLLDHNSIALVYGEPGVGKSFLALDLAARIATGRRWGECEVSAGDVLYVAAEAGIGFCNRAAALEGGPPERLTLLDKPVDLCSSHTDADALAQIAYDCQLVVIDTVARAMGGGDENSSADMGALLRNIDRIRKGTDGAAVPLVHHAGKNVTRGARGHSSLRAAIDTEIEIRASGGVSVARVTKQREMASGRVFFFTLEPVEIGRDRRGEPITSCRVRQVDQPAAKTAAPATPKALPLRGNMRLVRDALAEFSGENGAGADVENFKAFARERMPQGTAKLRAKAVRVAIEALVKAGVIAINGSEVNLK